MITVNFSNFQENFIFRELNDIFVTLVVSRLGHDLPTSVKDRVILQCFFFAKLRVQEISRK